MKKLLLFCIATALLFAACDKDKGKLDGNAKIKITGTDRLSRAASPAEARIHGTHCTDSVSFVSRYAFGWHCRWTDTDYKGGGSDWGVPKEIYDRFHDTINNRFFWMGSDVIHPNTGEIGEIVLIAEDIVFYAYVDEVTDKMLFPWETINGNYVDWVGLRKDTIAYIPNSVVRKARADITEAYNREDFSECYRLFDAAYIYIPITGAKWRELKAAGIE